MDVRQPEVAPGVAVGEPRVVDPEQVQDRGVEIVDMHGSLVTVAARSSVSPVGQPPLDSRAGQPA